MIAWMIKYMIDTIFDIEAYTYNTDIGKKNVRKNIIIRMLYFMQNRP
jgi:hypothetical protein